MLLACKIISAPACASLFAIANPIPDFKVYFKIFNDHLELRNNQKLHFELGRSIVGQCGILVSKVLYIKSGIKTEFAIIDAGMTELIRPALYQASHKIINISSIKKGTKRYDVVGPICESSDCFGKQLNLPETQRGDCIIILSCGAYGQVMASQYNLRSSVRSYYFNTISRKCIRFRYVTYFIMLKFCKTILKKVSFDKSLFRKELKKSILMLQKKDVVAFKIWCLSCFGNHKEIIIEVFEKNAY